MSNTPNNMPKRRSLLLGLLLLVIVTALVGAGVALPALSGPAATPTPPEPRALLQTVIANLRGLRSFKLLIEQTGAPYVFRVTLDQGQSVVDATMLRAEGQFENPNVLYANTRLKLGGLPPINVEIFARGADQWFKLISSGWIQYPIAEGFDPGRLVEEDAGFSKALADLDSVSYVDRVTLPDGTPAHHVRGIAKGQVINDLMFGLLGVWMDNIPADVYIDQQTLLPAKLVVTLPQTATPDVPQDTTWTIEIYDINAPSSIAYPDES